MILPVRRILPIMAVEHQQGQGTDQVFAAGEALPPGLAIGRVRQEPPDPLPTSYPGIVRRGEGHARQGK